MGVVRTWAGRAYGAAGTALLGPLAILLAGALVAIGGGVGDVGSLGQRESEGRRVPPDKSADSGPGAAGGDPVAGLVEVTRGVTTPVPPPVSPVAEPVLEGLLGPRGH